jgi:tetratricopeptide (TPR) repeat protein
MESERVPIQKIEYIPKELKPLLKEKSETNKKICVVIYPDVKYVNYIKHIIGEIKDVMGQYFEVETLSDTVKPQGSNFQTILELLKDCVLGIVILDGLRPNVLIEYGILIGLEKPIISLKDENAEIDIKHLDDKLKDISNPKLDIDKHLSDVKDLHWIKYCWGNPDNFKKILEENLEKLKENIISEVNKPLSTPEISNLSPEKLLKFQQKFSELAEYSIRFIKPEYVKIKQIDEKFHNLAKEYNVKLPSNYYFEIGNIYISIQKYNEALKAFEKTIKLKPNSTDAWYSKGIALVKLGKYNEALKAFKKAIKLKHDNINAWYSKGVTLGELGKYNEALKAFENTIKLKPNSADAWYAKGVTLGELGKDNEALKAFKKAIKLKPDNINAWHGKGVTLSELGKDNEALKAFEKTIKLKPNDADAWYGKGVTLSELGKDNEALKAFEKAIKLKPNDADVLYSKGIALIKLGKDNEALKAFEKAIKLKPNDADTWYGKGIALVKLGKYNEALKAFKKAIKLKPNDAGAWFGKACVFSKKRDKNNALKCLSKAISLDAKYKEMAKKDEDFKNFWNDKDFVKITT